MHIISAQQIENFLYDKENGFLIKYHSKDGIDPILLDEFYEILEKLKKNWKFEKDVPKDILYYLVSVIPALYRDLEIYKNDEKKYYTYDELIYNLNIAIEMCLNPDIDDPHFNTPLRELEL